VPADPFIGQIYSFSVTDVDGNKLATADGHITTIVIASSKEIDKARMVGDRTPDYCLGNPEFRMITVLRFEKRHLAPTRAIMKAVVRRQLAEEGRSLQKRYQARNIALDARRDVLCATDFDGAIGS